MAQVSETEPSGAGVLVTGADGFVGAALCGALTEAGVTVRRAVRGSRGTVLPHAAILVGDIGPKTDWRDALAGATCVVRLTARTHILRETAADPLAEYRRVNVEGTR